MNRPADSRFFGGETSADVASPAKSAGSSTAARRRGAQVGLGPRPTMHDVAVLAGVSLKTVSRVVNLEPGVKDDRRRLVEEAIVALGFRPNNIARSLRTGLGPAAVGLIIVDLLNPVYAAHARAVESIANRHGAVVVIASSSEDPSRERALAIDLLRMPVDGLILVPAGNDHRYLEPHMRLGAPVVFMARPAEHIEADAVVRDNVGGSRLAVEHLIAYGHRRIGFVGASEQLFTSRGRLEGYQAALVEAGIPVDLTLVRMGAGQVQLAQIAASQLLAAEDGPTAIFASDNRNCVGVLRAVQAAGRPIAVIGFDDFELAEMLPTPVTVVGYDSGDLGRTSAELLFSRLAGDARPPQRITLPVRLIPRGTGEIPPFAASSSAHRVAQTTRPLA